MFGYNNSNTAAGADLAAASDGGVVYSVKLKFSIRVHDNL